MAKPFRAGLVGCGAIACGNDASWLRSGGDTMAPLTHAGAYRRNPHTTLVAAADVDRVRLEQVGKDWGVTALYADYREMLRNEALDIVSVCAPSSLHAEIVREAGRLRVPAVFCEKPLAAGLDEALAVLRDCERSGTVLAVNYFRRWNATLEVWADRLASGELGRIRRANAYYTKGIVGNGTHVLDLLLWLVGRIESVQALRFVPGEDGDLAVDVLCLTETDIPCYLQACRQEDFNILELDILTDRGRIRVAANGRRIESYGIGPDPSYRQYRILDLDPVVTPTAWQDCLTRAVDDVVRCLTDGANPKCSGREAYEALQVATAIQASAKEGGRVVAIRPIDRPGPAAASVKERRG